MKQWGVDHSKAEGRGGGGSPDEGPSPVLRCWCSPLPALLVNHFFDSGFDLFIYPSNHPLKLPIRLPFVLI